MTMSCECCAEFGLPVCSEDDVGWELDGRQAVLTSSRKLPGPVGLGLTLVTVRTNTFTGPVCVSFGDRPSQVSLRQFRQTIPRTPTR